MLGRGERPPAVSRPHRALGHRSTCFCRPFWEPCRQQIKNCQAQRTAKSPIDGNSHWCAKPQGENFHLLLPTAGVGRAPRERTENIMHTGLCPRFLAQNS